MVKSNPQSNNGGTTGSSSSSPSTFIGFGVFAAATTTPTSTTSLSLPATNDLSTSNTGPGSYVWTPVYMGHDDTFRSLFTRIYQKREAITIAKALLELQTRIEDVQQHPQNKKVLVEAMKHYAYLYYHKLSIGSFTVSNSSGVGSGTGASSGGDSVKKDARASIAGTTGIASMMISTSTIRAYSVKIWYSFHQYIPKAVMQVCYNHAEILGIIYATQTDPSSEVRSTIPQLANEQQQQQHLVHPMMMKQPHALSNNVIDTKWQKCWDEGIIAYTTTRILSYSKPILLLEALCGHGTATTTRTQHQQRPNNISLNEQQRDTIDELYIRLVGNCLDCIGQWLLLLHQHQKQVGSNDSGLLITWDHFNIWFKPFLSYGTTSSATTGKVQNQQQPHAIRRKSYQLLTVITTYATFIYDLRPDSSNDSTPKNGIVGSSTGIVQKILLHAFSVEKDPVNVPHLVESVLSILAYNNRNSIDDGSSNDLLLMLLKPITKLFSKACYGAKVEIWGPMMLPLIGGQYSRTSVQQQHQLLSAIQVGIPYTFGIHEKYNIWIAICETSSFILLRSKTSTSANIDVSSTEQNIDETNATAKQIATLWIDGFRFFLSCTSNISKQTSRLSKYNDAASTPTVTNSSDGQYRLLQSITDQLALFHQTTTEKTICFFTTVPDLVDWFWSDGIALNTSNTSHLFSLVQLLQELQSRKEASMTPIVQPVFVKLIPILQTMFHATLQEQQISSISVPSIDVYQFFQAVLDYCGPQVIFNSSAVLLLNNSRYTSLQQFIMNDLLRWSVIHTSSLETEQRHERGTLLVQLDFVLLSTCLNAVPQTTRKETWESFIREIILAKCDLNFLVVGLVTVCTRSRQQINSNLDWLPCEELDKYAIDVGLRERSYFGNHVNECKDNAYIDKNDEKIDVTTTLLNFFRICLGISDKCNTVLISKDVISNWIQEIYNITTSPNSPQVGGSLLVAILEAVHRSRDLMSDDEMNCTLMSSWYCLDNPSIEPLLVAILNADSALRNSFQSSAQAQVRADFHSYISSETSDKTIKNWSQRVWFLSWGYEVGVRSFYTIGFECIVTWQRNPSAVFALAMSLLQRVSIVADRLELVKRWAVGDSVEFIVELLTSISEASNDFSLAAKCKNRTDRGALYLRAIGGSVMNTNFVDQLVLAAINKISDVLQQGIIDDKIIQQRVAILSLLLELKFPPCEANNLDVLSAEEVKEDDRLWYITDSKHSQNREEVKVAKVHFDSTTGFYFSIVVNRDGEFVERQTVVERLRKRNSTKTTGEMTRSDSNSQQDCEERKKLRNLICNIVIGDYASVARSPNIGELVNVLVTQIGLGDERGIGSVYYELLRLVNNIENDIYAATEDGDDGKFTKFVWTLSLSLGFGLNTPDSAYLLLEMWTDHVTCVTRILDYYIKHDVAKDISLDTAVALFLITVGCGTKIHNHNIIHMERFLTSLFSISSSALDAANTATEKMSSVISYRGILEGISLCSVSGVTVTYGSPVFEALQKALHVSIQYFSENEGISTPDSLQISCLQQIVSSCINHIKFNDMLSNACVSNAQGLCNCLFIPSKRSIAFKLLELLSARGKAYLNDDEVVLANETAIRLQRWTKGLNEDDIAIIEEDVYIVAEWMPARLMVEIEAWDDAGFEMENESTIVGRLLCWFCCLRFVESAAPQNFRNRPAFISYLGKSAAAFSILNLGLLHNDIVNGSHREITPTVDEVSVLLERNIQPDVTQLATLSLFRTVEVLPSLCRRWWEDDCPRVYSGPVQALIEKFVAPEILKRELDRMKSSTLFGKMVVSSSLVSREVTANYVQDDFTLRVVIALPAAFPFRSAEVDCSKTLGVPQSRWKRWSLQITLMLNSQGGTLQDALMLWKENVDKEFEGVEPCPVCYSVLHVKTHKLPCLQCKTCQNRFHMECLTEWFRSSGKSQCVLCQQPWQGTRV